MDSTTKLNEDFQKIVGMYKQPVKEIPTYESMMVKIIFKAYNKDN